MDGVRGVCWLSLRDVVGYGTINSCLVLFNSYWVLHQVHYRVDSVCVDDLCLVHEILYGKSCDNSNIWECKYILSIICK